MRFEISGDASALPNREPPPLKAAQYNTIAMSGLILRTTMIVVTHVRWVQH